MIRLICGCCFKELKAPPAAVGKLLQCSGCASRLRVPDTSGQTVTAVHAPPKPPPTPGTAESPLDLPEDEPPLEAIPVPDDPENPFAFDDTPAAPRSDPVLSDVRRLHLYWKRKNDGKSMIDPAAERIRGSLTDELLEFGTVQGVFLVGATPQSMPWRDTVPYICGFVIFAALATAGCCLGDREMRRTNLPVGIAAIPVAILAGVGWWMWPRPAPGSRLQMLLLYDVGFVQVHGEECRKIRWEHIGSVEVRPEVQTDSSVIGPDRVYSGHRFRVRTLHGTELFIGMEYFGNIELGLAIMERAAAVGAACTGKVNIPRS